MGLPPTPIIEMAVLAGPDMTGGAKALPWAPVRGWTAVCLCTGCPVMLAADGTAIAVPFLLSGPAY